MNLKLKTTHILQTPYYSITSTENHIALLNQNHIDVYNQDFNKINTTSILKNQTTLKYHRGLFSSLNIDKTKLNIYNDKLETIKTICLKKIIQTFGTINNCTPYNNQIILSLNNQLIKINIHNNEHLETLPYPTSYPFLTTYQHHNTYCSLINTATASYITFNEPCNHTHYALNKQYKDFIYLNQKYYFLYTKEHTSYIDEYVICNAQEKQNKQSKNKILCSIANIENGLANILHQQANQIEKAIETSTIQDLIQLNHSTQETIDTINQLENNLILKLKQIK